MLRGALVPPLQKGLERSPRSCICAQWLDFFEGVLYTGLRFSLTGPWHLRRQVRVRLRSLRGLPFPSVDTRRLASVQIRQLPRGQLSRIGDLNGINVPAST
jgi:hypothetical protein